jgi:tetratricopeptide (TPR) repeat protein
MKQPKYKIVDSLAAAPAPVQTISDELTHIRKLIDANKKLDAWNTAKALHDKHPHHPVANYGMALAIYNAGQNSAALPYAEAAVRQAPENALYHMFLGKLYVDLEMLEFAPAALDKAVALDRTMFQAPWIMAQYYYGLGLGDKALQYYRKALEVAPKESIHRIKLAFADVAASQGLIGEAEECYSELLGDLAVRRMALVGLALLRKHDHQSVVAGQIRHELAAADLNDRGRSEMLLCLGRLYENGGKYDEAFRSFHESRKLMVSVHDFGEFRSQIDDRISTITHDVMAKFQGFGDPSIKPIFVVGMPRSGTTLTEQIIASHSQADGAGELKRLDRMARKLADGKGMAEILAKMVEAGPSRWKAIPQQYLNLLNAVAPGAPRVVDKMPHNFAHLGFIRLCFPNARIIHCRRNPLDNFISAFQNRMSNSHGYAYDQVKYGEYYLEYVRLMNHWKTVFPAAIHELQYENLTRNPQTEVRKMLDFLGLPWEEACLSFHDRESTVKTFSRMQVRSPINTGSVARWHNYEKHLAPIISVFNQAGVEC